MAALQHKPQLDAATEVKSNWSKVKLKYIETEVKSNTEVYSNWSKVKLK